MVIIANAVKKESLAQGQIMEQGQGNRTKHDVATHSNRRTHLLITVDERHGGSALVLICDIVGGVIIVRGSFGFGCFAPAVSRSFYKQGPECHFSFIRAVRVSG